jgi:hypothetical protein
MEKQRRPLRDVSAIPENAINAMTDVKHLTNPISLTDNERQRCEVWTA